MVLGSGRIGLTRAQAGEPDDFLSWGPLCCAMARVVSPRMGKICDVANPVPPSRTSYDNVIDASGTAPCREAALCKASGDCVLLAAQGAPSVLLGALFG